MPKHIVEFPLQQISYEDFIAFATKACEELKWTVTFLSESGLRAESPMSYKRNTYGEEITLLRKDGLVEIKSKSKRDMFFDFGRNRKNIESLLGKIEILRNTTDAHESSQLKQAIMENQATGEDDLLNPDSSAAREEKKWWKIFIPSRDLFITPLIIDINIVLFLLMVITSGSFGTLFLPDSDTLIKWGGNFKPYTLDGEWWRLFTCMFEHIGIIHLVMNMYALLYVGIFLEPILGKVKFIAAYVITGIAASMISLWWHDNTVSAGASGAIFGMYGVFLALLLTNIIDPQVRKSLLPSLGIFIGYNLLFGIKAGVDNAAHIGGLVSGLFTGIVLYISLKQPQNKMLEKIILASLIGLTLAGSVFGMYRIKNPVGDYLKIMTKYSEYEEKALNVYRLPESTDQETLLAFYNNTTIPNLALCNEELQKIHQLNLPDELKQRVSKMDEYTTLRIKEANLRKKSLTENTTNYVAEIDELVNRIDALLKELNQ